MKVYLEGTRSFFSLWFRHICSWKDTCAVSTRAGAHSRLWRVMINAGSISR